MKFSKVQYKYCVEENEVVKTRLRPCKSANIPGYLHLSIDGTLIISYRYAWDGITNGVNLKCNRTAGLVHDALYQLMREGELDLSFKTQCDEELRDIMASNGAPQFLANFFFFMVQKFGNAFATKKKKVYEV